MNKINVMIVDDEKLVIEDLLTIVDWEANGFEIVATAVNGKQALSKFMQYHPQVIFTDIKMPFMDGIGLIKQIREKDKQVQIIVLTAYEDFAYAKSAIQHGIMDYVIKSTIDNQMATNLLKRIRTVIEKQGQVLDILKEKQISDFFYASEEDFSIPNMEMFKMFQTPYCYLLIEQNMPINLPGDHTIDGISIHKTDVISALLEGKDPEYKIVAASHTSRDQILLVLDVSKRSQQDINQIVYQSAIQNKNKLQKQFQIEFTIYMVNNKMNLYELKKLYETKINCFYQKYLMDDKGIYNLIDLQLIVSNKSSGKTLDTKLIIDCIKEFNEIGLKEYIEDAFVEIDNYKELNSISRELYDLLKQYYKQISIEFDSEDLSFEVNWKYWLNAKDLKDWFENAFMSLIKKMKATYYKQYSRVITQAMEYIYLHHSDSNLAINDIADEVKLSTGYLCVLFKKETGKTLNGFIMEVRIGQAKKLLYENKLKVYEISAAVGFQSSQYFSQVFIKHVGISPNEYQKGNSKHN